MVIRKYCCQILLLWMQAASTGYGQSPGPEHSGAEQSSFYGRTICETFNKNMTAPELVVCPEGNRYCFTTGYITRRGELQVMLMGCWLRPQSEEGLCHKRSCLFGIRHSIGSKTERTCCCKGFVCNKNSTHVNQVLVEEKPSTTSQTTYSESPAKKHKASRVKEISPKETVILGVISSVFATFLILSIVFVSWRCAARKNKLTLPSKARPVEKSVEDIVEYSVMSTDGISFSNLIHKGKFAEIWTAKMDGRKVAFKIYKHEYCANWKKEKKTYDVLGAHPNVAQFLSGVELLGPYKSGKAIILTYYPCGSLLQFLTSNVLSWRAMYNLVFSLASGVAYIHGEIDEYDHYRRKVIVHRNLNSGNVLVKNDETCVLADFGTAVHVTGKQILPTVEGENIFYMPPEVLCDSVNWNDWESSLKQADVYSVGLIFWEIVRRCRDFYTDHAPVPDAILPYQLELGDTPSAAQMIAHVHKERKRPLFPVTMIEPDKSDALLRSTIEECWDTEPEARLTALCVVKRMQEVRNNKTNNDDFQRIEESYFEFSPSESEQPSQGDTEESSSLGDIRLNELCIDRNDGQLASKYSWSSGQSEDMAERRLLKNAGCIYSDETC